MLKRSQNRILIWLSAVLINIFAVFKIYALQVYAFNDVFASLMYTLGIVLGEIGGAVIINQTYILEASGRRRDFVFRTWGIVVLVVLNAFEVLNIAVSVNLVLNNLPSMSAAFASLVGGGISVEAAGMWLSWIIGIILPGVALSWYLIAGQLRSAEARLQYHGYLDAQGRLKNPEASLKTSASTSEVSTPVKLTKVSREDAPSAEQPFSGISSSS